MNVCEELGARIATARNGLGLTQAELGERLGVPRGTVAAWEGGARVPGRAHLDVIGTTFGWSEDERAENALLAQRAAVERASQGPAAA